MLWHKLQGARATATQSSSRGVFGGGFVDGSGSSTRIDYIDISTTGNSTFFGSLTVARERAGGVSNGTRGVFGYGYRLTPSGGGFYSQTYPTNMDYITIATASNATSFGSVTSPRYAVGSVSSSTRGVFSGGVYVGFPTTTYSSMHYITIATTGSTSTFGNLTIARLHAGGVSDGTRGVFGGGSSSSTLYSRIDYITIATTGNATVFGSLTTSRSSISGVSNGSRGVFGGNLMDYIQISTAGDATSFGDFMSASSTFGGVSSPERGVFSNGATGAMEYITISTTGNSTSFGSLSVARSNVTGVSEFV